MGKIYDIKSVQPFEMKIELYKYNNNELDENGDPTLVTETVMIRKPVITQREYNMILKYSSASQKILQGDDVDGLMDEVIDNFQKVFGKTREFWEALDYSYFVQILGALCQHSEEAVKVIGGGVKKK